MKVLIVDDSAEMRKTIRAHCEEVADEFAEASNGAVAIETCGTFKPDWVLMDMQMGPMNGLTAIRQILRRWKGTQVAMVTIFDDHELRAAASEAGAAAFITKDRLVDLPALLKSRKSP